MNESINDEIDDHVDGTHIRKKENDFFLKPGSSNILLSNEMVTPGVDDYPDSSKNPYSNILDAKDLDRIGSSEHASASPRCMDDAGVMVEELTLKNYDGENMTIVGTSNNRERLQNMRNQWQNMYQITGGSGIKGKGQATSSAREEGGNNLFSGLLHQNQPLPNYNHNAVMDNLLSNDDKGTSDNNLYSSGGIRTKILSKSGFSDYFIKSTLRGKGVIHKGQNFRGSGPETGAQGRPTSDIACKGVILESHGIGGLTNPVAPLSLTTKPASPPSHGVSEQRPSRSSNNVSDGISLREWLGRVRRKVTKVESTHIFRQILDLVDFSHSRGVFLQDLRPSNLKLSKSYKVTYIGSSVRVGTAKNVTDEDIAQSNHNRSEKRPIHQGMPPLDNHSVKKPKLGEHGNFIRMWPQCPARSGARSASINITKVDSAEAMDSGIDVDEDQNPQTETKSRRKLFGFGNSMRKSSQPLQAKVDNAEAMDSGIDVDEDQNPQTETKSRRKLFGFGNSMRKSSQPLQAKVDNAEAMDSGIDVDEDQNPQTETKSRRKLFGFGNSMRKSSQPLQAKVDNAEAMDSGIDVDEDQNPETETKSRRKLFGFGNNMLKSSQPLQDSVSHVLEQKWYACPELLNRKGCTFASNIYCLGVLLFELLGSFDSGRSHAAAMLDLHHRILPPSFLSENPKEAGFCLWLLHPEPSLRPTTRDILQSDFVSEIQELSGVELLPSINEEDVESELLLYFLSSLNDQKQKDASNLLEQIQNIEADIQEVEKRCPKHHSPGVEIKDPRLTSNYSQLETAYFAMRSSIQPSGSDLAPLRDVELLKSRGKWGMMEKEHTIITSDPLGGFFDGLCKYARYSKFKVRGILRNGEFSNSANVISSLSFDRDEDYLATGGVSKKIKIFELQALFNDSVDIHYPVVEMTNKSKLTSICWNGYIRNYLASTDYDGIVKLWDASTGQGFSQFSEHSERAWSVDFSRVDPTKLASGSDDRLVKVWNINDKNSLCTIRNNANVCCVQFSADSSHLLSFSTADYKTLCYDLRNVSIPWCVLAGHEKAVSYVKFLDAGTLVTASTDNTLKIWDLNKTSSNSLSRDACVLTLRGHTNEKNFVGLSVANGYITCGSETNEVFAYHRSLPMPITAHKFGSIDSITGKETEDDNGQFVSSVCWRRKSNMVVAASSSGCIKLLQMV